MALPVRCAVLTVTVVAEVRKVEMHAGIPDGFSCQCCHDALLLFGGTDVTFVCAQLLGNRCPFLGVIRRVSHLIATNRVVSLALPRWLLLPKCLKSRAKRKTTHCTKSSYN